MNRFWQGEHHDIEAELSTCRPEARPAFLAALGEDLDRWSRRPRIVRRTAFATAVTVAMLSLFATLGGIGYASSAANGAFHVSKIGRLVGISQHHSPRVLQDQNPVFGDQYRPGKGCGDKNHVHFRENECKKTH
jgi:hypothetical protein